MPTAKEIISILQPSQLKRYNNWSCAFAELLRPDLPQSGPSWLHGIATLHLSNFTFHIATAKPLSQLPNLKSLRLRRSVIDTEAIITILTSGQTRNNLTVFRLSKIVWKRVRNLPGVCILLVTVAAQRHWSIILPPVDGEHGADTIIRYSCQRGDGLSVIREHDYDFVPHHPATR